MPTFIDRHSFTAIPSGLAHQLYLETKHEIRDPHGVRAMGHWAEHGVIYCILDAPDAVAAHQYHLDRGLPCDELQALGDLDGRVPTSDEDQATVRAAIARLWQSVARSRVAQLRGTLDETLNTSHEHV